MTDNARPESPFPVAHNPYAAPGAKIDAPLSPSGEAESDFYTMSVTKLVVMMMLTYGVYGVVWAYRHWCTIRDRHGEDVWPVPRAIFSGFTYFDLAKRMRTRLTLDGIAEPAGFGSAALIYLLTSVAINMSNRIEVSLSLDLMVTASLIGISAYALTRGQLAANLIAARRGPVEYDNRLLTPGSVFFGLVFGLVWLTGIAEVFGVWDE